MAETRPMTQAEPDRRCGGFTLLELLIVIVILSLVVVMLTGGVRFAGRAWASQERLIDQQGDVSAVQTVLRQLIADGHGFSGDNTSLHFVGQLPKALQRGGLFDIDVLMEEDRLVASWRPHFTGTGPKPDPTETKLLDNVAGLDVAYYFGKDKEQPSWQTALPSDKSVTPQLVVLRIARANGPAWPALVVAPMIDTQVRARPAAPPGAAPPGAPAAPKN
jgi:prepilin-type N-terminal cleavage/methylation domain-containing protein